MTLTLHAISVGTFAPMLGTLTHLMEKARAHAKAKGTDVSALMAAKLAPDMFPFRLQVQIACFHARNGVARLTGQEPPAIDNPEETLEQLEARVKATLEWLRGVNESAFAGGESRTIAFPAQGREGMEFRMTGLQFLRDWTVPHFFFHVVTAYDVLRAQGVEIGKRDYVPNVGQYLQKKA